MAKRRLDNRRRKQRNRIVREANERLLDSLSQLSEGKTPPERIKAHTEFYATCDTADQLFLLKIFKDIENKEETELAEFFAEKQNGR